MNQQFKDITMWQRKVFPHATVESCAAHLKDEIEEIIEAHQNKQEIAFLSAELADAYILLIGMVDRAGLDLKDLYTAVEAKMEINKRRVWGEPDERGVVKHIHTKPLPCDICYQSDLCMKHGCWREFKERNEPDT